jgi:hypothetical protein
LRRRGGIKFNPHKQKYGYLKKIMLGEAMFGWYSSLSVGREM